MERRQIKRWRAILLEDKIVPPNQAALMVVAIREKKIPVAYMAFEGEQHGFRRAEHSKRSLENTLYFSSRVFDFALAEKGAPAIKALATRSSPPSAGRGRRIRRHIPR